MFRNKCGYLRDYRAVRLRLIQTTFVSLLIVIIFHDLGGDSYKNIMNLAGALFFCSMYATMNNLMMTILTF